MKKYVVPTLLLFACFVIGVGIGALFILFPGFDLAQIAPMSSIAPSSTPAMVRTSAPHPTSTPKPTPNATSTQEARATATARIETALDYLPGEEIYLSRSNGHVRVTLNYLDWDTYWNSDELLHSSDVWASLVVENLGARTIHANPYYFTIVDGKGRIYSHASESYRSDVGFTAIDLQPGTHTVGGLVFDLDFHTYPAHLIYDDGFTPAITLDIGEWLVAHEPGPTPTATPIAWMDIDQSVEYVAGLGTITVVVHSLHLDEDSVRLEYSIRDQNQRQVDWSVHDDPHNCGHRFALFQDNLPLSPLPVPGAPLCGRKRWTKWSWVEYFSPVSRAKSTIFIQVLDGYTYCTISLDPIEIGICEFLGHILVVEYSGR